MAYLGFLSSVLAKSKYAEPVHTFSRPVSQILLLSRTIRCRCDTFCDTRRWHQKLPYGLFTASSAQTAYLGFPSSVLANSKHEEPVYMFPRPVSQLLSLLGTIRFRCDTCCNTRRQHRNSLRASLRPPWLSITYHGPLTSVMTNLKHEKHVCISSRHISQFWSLLEIVGCRCDAFWVMV